MPRSSLINTPLQRGDAGREEDLNRFSGFPGALETRAAGHLFLTRISASPAGRQKIAHRFTGGYRPWREASPARNGRILSSLTGLGARLALYPPMNRWAIFCRPAGLG